MVRMVFGALVGLSGLHDTYGAPVTAPAPYQQLLLTEPLDQTTLRDNGGDVTVRVELSPPLQLAHRHRLKLLIDGRLRTLPGGELSLVLKNLDRGTHVIVALVVDQGNTELMRSAPVTIYLHRRSLLHPNQKEKRAKKPD
jgi:hypothetical protein